MFSSTDPLPLPGVHEFQLQEPELGPLADHGLLLVADHQGAFVVEAHQGLIVVDAHHGFLVVDIHQGFLVVDIHHGFLVVDAHQGFLVVDAHQGFIVVDSHQGLVVVEIDQGLRDVAIGGFLAVVTSPPNCPVPMAISEQALNSSCGPHPTLPFPSGQTPQLFPPTYLHWRTQWVHSSPDGS